jgi:hypothetical protein
LWPLSIAKLMVSDPVSDGFVASLAKPGGNITGFTIFEHSFAGKWLEMLKEERAPNGGLVLLRSNLAANHRGVIAAAAMRHRLPSIYSQRVYPTMMG